MEKARKSGNKNMKYSEAFEEFVADSMEKMLTDQNAVEKLVALRTKDKSVFDKLREGIQKLVDRIKQEYAKLTPDSAEGRIVATMTDVFSDIQDLFFEALDDASNNFQKYENKDSFEKSSIDTERSVKYSNKTRYDEFASLVMQWAYSASTEVGDTKIFANKSGKFSLFEKTENGYIEIARGNYKKVRAEYERANNDTEKQFYEYFNKIRSERNRSMRNNISTEDGGDANRSVGQVRSKGLQTDTTRNNKHLQSGDKGKSVKFSLRENIEETKELVAVHNLSAEKLLKSLNLGGLPMPSIAIMKAKDGHNQFGDISLVFRKDTIDPEADKVNKVYSGDAWTPTYPRTEYKVNEDVASKIYHRARCAGETTFFKPVHFHPDNIERQGTVPCLRTNPTTKT